MHFPIRIEWRDIPQSTTWPDKTRKTDPEDMSRNILWTGTTSMKAAAPSLPSKRAHLAPLGLSTCNSPSTGLTSHP